MSTERVILYGPNGAILVPSAAALGDADANPTTTAVGVFPEVFDDVGATWARARQAPNAASAVARTGLGLVSVGLQRAANSYQALGSVELVGDSGVGSPVAATGLFHYNAGDALWNRYRNQNSVAYLASQQRSGDTNGANRTNFNFRGLAIFFNVSLVGSPAASVTMRVQCLDDTSGNFVSIASAAVAVATTGQRAYLLYPTAENNEGWTEHFNTMLGSRVYRVQMDHANEGPDNSTYSVTLIEIP